MKHDLLRNCLSGALVGLLALSMAVGCQEEPEFEAVAPIPEAQATDPAQPGASNPAGLPGTVSAQPPATVPVATVPAVPLPENTQITGDHLFSMDTAQTEYELTLHGRSHAQLLGRLASPDGKREIVIRDGRGEQPEETTVFAADWLLPAVGAVNHKGQILVCVNRLTGHPTTLTQGDMPDPNTGVDLVCRMFTGDRWLRETQMHRLAAAHWLHEVLARPDGSFWVSYSLDQSGRMVDDPVPGDAMYRVTFKAGRFGTPQPARTFRLPTQ